MTEIQTKSFAFNPLQRRIAELEAKLAHSGGQCPQVLTVLIRVIHLAAQIASHPACPPDLIDDAARLRFLAATVLDMVAEDCYGTDGSRVLLDVLETVCGLTLPHLLPDSSIH
jgi:hypothetical protein